MTGSLLPGSQRSTKENGKIADPYLKLPVSEAGMLDFAALDSLIEIGCQSAVTEVGFRSRIIRERRHLTPPGNP
jgi:hypothetical protein